VQTGGRVGYNRSQHFKQKQHSNLFTKSTPAVDSSPDAVRRLLLSKETIVITM